MTMTLQDRSAEDRFWSKVEKSETCWLWTGYIKPNGYASFYPGGGRHVAKVYAHRFAFELRNGAVPDGMELDHTCNVRNCVNPDHLEAVTHRTNLDRAIERRTHCKQGHPYSAENTYVWRGNRSCRACKRLVDSAKREAA